MKKSILLAAALASLTASAQSSWSFEPTKYRGAFAPAPATMWTDQWTNWDPQTTAYGTPTVTVASNIVTNTTWTSNNVYLLSGPVYVKNNATLTIEPGTVIRGNVASAGSALIITKGAKLVADGTMAQPIVFTSSAAPGSRAIGDWGGIVLLGKAANNLSNGIGNIEGLPSSPDTEYGGGTTPDDNDNSGVLKFVRIEFGGYAYQVDKEINGLTMGSVGRNTVIDYVQTSFINDDAFEWFGGTVNAKHLVSYRNLDDDLDCDFGFRGSVQYALIVRDPQIADQSSGSTSEGFECDNNGAGDNATPKTAASFSNVTAIGPLRGNVAATVDPKHRRALRLRRNSEMKIFNSIFMDFREGVHVDGSASEARANEELLRFRNNIIAGTLANKRVITNSGSTFSPKRWVAANMNDTLVSSANILTTPYDYTNPDYRPAAGSLALVNFDYNDQAFPAFETAAFRGAFEAQPTPMWTGSWVNWDPQNTAYAAPTVTVNANITVDTRWTSNNVYLLSGPIYVKDGAILTIEPGTVVRGDFASAGSALVITKGSKLVANGTEANPIVFTSSAAVGSRAIGDWGGIVVLGKATNNLSTGLGNIEGLPAGPDTEFGGGTTPNDDDNSGVLKYVRIEFGGYAYQVDKEINGLTMGSVGRNTVIDFVQTSFINDDAFEWFGGKVNAKHLVSYRNLDDDMDCDFGYQGNVQYVLIVRDPQIADQSSGSTSEGFECDNNGAGDGATPKTAATFRNVTAVGPYRGSNTNTIDPKFKRGMRLRRNSEMKIYDGIFIDFKEGLHVDGTACEANAQAGTLIVNNTLIAGCAPNKIIITNSGSTFNPKAWFMANGNDTAIASTNILQNPYNYLTPDYRLYSNISVDEQTLQNDRMIVYPNPANTFLQVAVSNTTVERITVVNAMGALVAVADRTDRIEVADWNTGLYFITVETTDGSVLSSRFQVVK
ncbi:MAG: T9SS type A sorting domain-containing protein [Schleiferiaceae bacterium]|nr:T9SS type A sorting domain-containing protein [Schleiferiaceae bacterium]MDP4858789.1 T9SS type A sorting domain-containing protein [Schleiferiaceae bacterium]